VKHDLVDELYDAPLADFVARRNAIVARLRKAGHADEAKAVAAVAKPKATVWAVNRVARAAPKLVKRVAAAFDALKTAQLRAPEKMAAASTDFREATEAVAHEAIAAMKESGLATTLDTHRRLANTLRGAAASARDELLEGRLAGDVAPAGFDLFGGAMPRGRRPRVRVVEKKPAPARDDLARRRAAALEDEARAHERTAQSASAALQEARERLRELEERARSATRTATTSRGLAARAQEALREDRPAPRGRRAPRRR
jgi:hypothetical protein